MRLYASLVPALFLIGSQPVACVVKGVVDRTPLAVVSSLISKGEGSWDSVNRGSAGDTPGGIRSITGRSLSEMTVREVQQLQRTTVFAVGRYQMIPSTLDYAIKMSGVSEEDHFTPAVQDKLLQTLIDHKRPDIGAFIRGQSHDIELAMKEMALEWASIPYYGSSSYYGGSNRAHVTKQEVRLALQRARDLYLGSPKEASL